MEHAPRSSFTNVIEDDDFREHAKRSSINLSVSESEHVIPHWRSFRDRDTHFTQKNKYRRNLIGILRAIDYNIYGFLRYACWTIWALFLMMVLGMNDLVFEKGYPTCPSSNDNDGGEMLRNERICGLGTKFMDGAYELRLLSSFVLAGFVLTSRSLWLTRRLAYCELCGATRNLLININSLMPEGNRKRLSRWAVLGYELSVLKARSLIDSEQGKSYLEKAKLLSKNEWDSMVDGDRHTTVWFWVQSKAAKLKNDGKITHFELQTICNAITLSREKANDLMLCIAWDQPPPYATVVALLINTSLLFYSTAKGFEWAKEAHDAGGWNVFTLPGFYLDIVIVFVSTTIYALLFDVCSTLYNPFGPRKIDIPHYAVGTVIRNLAKSLSNTETCYPDTMDEERVDDMHLSIDPRLFEDMELELASEGVKRRSLAKNFAFFGRTHRSQHGLNSVTETE